MISQFPDWRPVRSDAAEPLLRFCLRSARTLLAGFRDELRAGAAMPARPDRYGRAARWILLAAGIAFIVHVILAVGLGQENPTAYRLWHLGIFRLDRDGSIPEFLEYGLIGLAAYAMWRAAAACNSVLLRMIAFTHGYLFADNAFNLHEKAGRNLPFADKADGEAAFLIGVSAVVACLLVYGFARDRGRLTGIALVNGCYFAAMAVFAIAVDFIHSAFDKTSFAVNHTLSVVEDGGEMAVIVLLGVYSLSVLVRLQPAKAAGTRPA